MDSTGVNIRLFYWGCWYPHSRTKNWRSEPQKYGFNLASQDAELHSKPNCDERMGMIYLVASPSRLEGKGEALKANSYSGKE